MRGIGQACFMNTPFAGLPILVAMVVSHAWLGFAGALGVVASTATAIALGMDRGAILANVFIGAPASLFTPWARPR